MPSIVDTVFSVEEYLANEQQKDLLRFSTAGSVDDGKSTLIGRLLYDTQSVYEDQIRSIEGKGTTAPGQIDYALLTDGLRAEREQGITIDVAYRYFSTARRKFIIADTPGHEQYTRNMATGASTADAAVVLIDASKGVLPQSLRHAYIASLLRVRHLLVAVNKMDLIGYDDAAYRAIEADFTRHLNRIAEDTGTPVQFSFIPVSALAGDNVVHRSTAMPWYSGPSLLELLESLPSSLDTSGDPFRFAVQRVVRPDHTFRGFAGQIASGVVRPGDPVTVLPSGNRAQIARIVTYDGDLDEAFAPLSVTLVLDREIDISRGDLLVATESVASVARQIQASLVWMDQRPLDRTRRYLLKHTSHTVPVYIASIAHRTNIESLAHEAVESLRMNDIGVVSLDLLRPIAFDRYRENRSTGAFILVDAATNSTVAAGMISNATNSSTDSNERLRDPWGRVTEGEREARWGHRGGVLKLSGSSELVDAIERSLFAIGAVTVRLESNDEAYLLHPNLLDVVSEIQLRSGLLVLVVEANDSETLTVEVEDREVIVAVRDAIEASAAVHHLLQEAGILIAPERAGL